MRTTVEIEHTLPEKLQPQIPLIDTCVCGGRSFDVVSTHGLLCHRCPVCLTLHRRVFATPIDVELYYNFGYHRDRTRHAGVVGYDRRYDQDRAAACARIEKYSEVLDIHGKEWMNVRALDVGCGNGAFVDELRSRNVNALGQDPDPVDVDGKLKRWYIATGRIREVVGIYELVTYHDVLEHLVDPRAEIELALERVCAGGHLIIEVPDVSVPEGRKHYKPEHLWYFSTVWTGPFVWELVDRIEIVDEYCPIPGKRTTIWRRR